MKKIPTIFERDWNGDRSRVLDVPHRDCGWVFAGEGVATRKLDGTCCLVRGGALYKRRELREGEEEPAGFALVGRDPETGKAIGWMPVGDGPEDRWHRLAATAIKADTPEGTYELVGPRINGNPEGAPGHFLQPHGTGMAGPVDGVPRTFDSLRAWLAAHDVEGIVFHHPDGRMGKIKGRDFGLRRRRPAA